MAEENNTPDPTTGITPPITGSALIERLGEQTTGGEKAVPSTAKIAPKPQEIAEDELLTKPDDLTLVEQDASTSVSDGLNVPTATQDVVSTYSATKVAPNTPEATAAQGKVSAESLIGDVQGAVSNQAQAIAQTEEVDQKATVQYQLGELFKSLEDGTSLPAWAAPAVRSVNGLMAQRGLGSSSMAASAITQAIYESGIPIAKIDADRYGTLQLQNLNNKQQAVLQNAMTFASMDKANLDARLNAAVNNANRF